MGPRYQPMRPCRPLSCVLAAALCLLLLLLTPLCAASRPHFDSDWDTVSLGFEHGAVQEGGWQGGDEDGTPGVLHSTRRQALARKPAPAPAAYRLTPAEQLAPVCELPGMPQRVLFELVLSYQHTVYTQL